MPRTIELYLFRFRDPVSGRWQKSRYRCERDEILRRHPEAEVLEATKEVRQVPDDWTTLTYRGG